MPEPPSSANSVQISLARGWEIEVDDHIHRLDVDTPRDQVSRDQNARCLFLGEVMEDPVSLSLVHFGVDVKARVLQLDDFLGEELNSQRRVAEDDDLVYFELYFSQTISLCSGNQTRKTERPPAPHSS